MRVDISVLIPTYNRLWALPKAIESCRHSNARIEIIVVDDGSTDGTWEWLQKQQDLHSVRQDNFGKGWAVNRAFALSRGEYIRFLDSDDWLSASSNDEQLALAREGDADIVAAPHVVVDAAGRETRVNPTRVDDDFIAQMLIASLHYSAFLFRRNLVVDIPHRHEFGGIDIMFTLETAIKLPKVVVSDNPALFHLQHDEPRLLFQQGLRGLLFAWQILSVYRRSEKLLEHNGLLTPYRKRVIATQVWPLVREIAAVDLCEARRTLDWITTLDPQFKIRAKGRRRLMYQCFGFVVTERIISLRNILRYGQVTSVKPDAVPRSH
jgi:glycosyltransferase involved in cell wall biosynthesis